MQNETSASVTDIPESDHTGSTDEEKAREVKRVSGRWFVGSVEERFAVSPPEPVKLTKF